LKNGTTCWKIIDGMANVWIGKPNKERDNYGVKNFASQNIQWTSLDVNTVNNSNIDKHFTTWEWNIKKGKDVEYEDAYFKSFTLSKYVKVEKINCGGEPNAGQVTRNKKN
jgi:hypothetical protein